MSNIFFIQIHQNEKIYQNYSYVWLWRYINNEWRQLYNDNTLLITIIFVFGRHNRAVKMLRIKWNISPCSSRLIKNNFAKYFHYSDISSVTKKFQFHFSLSLSYLIVSLCFISLKVYDLWPHHISCLISYSKEIITL